ncbi:hypothetical protein GCM10025759_27460 [Lysobacter panacisoli]|uniref:Uncharacterized protein n=1 Tax=Lysobacter panacisoli TaxID=1255263 RepID=A0ABP9LMN0_9GAMM
MQGDAVAARLQLRHAVAAIGTNGDFTTEARSGVFDNDGLPSRRLAEHGTAGRLGMYARGKAQTQRHGKGTAPHVAVQS